MSVNIILATDLNFGIGNENDLPWPKNKEDLKWFKDNTMNGVVVMGRKTWESIGSKKLPGRTNVVISSKILEGADATYAGDMKDIIDLIKTNYQDKDIWIIGGAEIYFQAIPLADKLYLTTINQHCVCDTYVERDIIVKFPYIDFWKENEHVTFQIRNSVPK